jgi:hypothetical protein
MTAPARRAVRGSGRARAAPVASRGGRLVETRPDGVLVERYPPGGDYPFEVVVHGGPLPPLADDPLTPAELAFRQLIAGVVVGDRVEIDPAFADWSARVRLAWERENILWLQGYANGKPVWGRDRPPPEKPDRRAPPPAGSGKASKEERFKRASAQQGGNQ